MLGSHSYRQWLARSLNLKHHLKKLPINHPSHSLLTQRSLQVRDTEKKSLRHPMKRCYHLLMSRDILLRILLNLCTKQSRTHQCPDNPNLRPMPTTEGHSFLDRRNLKRRPISLKFMELCHELTFMTKNKKERDLKQWLVNLRVKRTDFFSTSSSPTRSGSSERMLILSLETVSKDTPKEKPSS